MQGPHAHALARSFALGLRGRQLLFLLSYFLAHTLFSLLPSSFPFPSLRLLLLFLRFCLFLFRCSSCCLSGKRFVVFGVIFGCIYGVKSSFVATNHLSTLCMCKGQQQQHQLYV